MKGFQGASIRSFTGEVCCGFGNASASLAPVMSLIEARMGLSPLVAGTLNLRIPHDYIVRADAVITPAEYGKHGETIKLQRCVIGGVKAIIMRPDLHETRTNWGHGKAHLELLGAIRFRDRLGLSDGATVTVEVEGDEMWWAAAAPR